MTKKNILNLSSIILGFIYVIVILWNRLLRERLPRDLLGNYDTYIFAIYCVLLLSSAILFFYYLRQILQIQSRYLFLSKILKITFIQNSVNFFLEYIVKAPYKSYIWVYNKIMTDNMTKGKININWTEVLNSGNTRIIDTKPREIPLFLVLRSILIENNSRYNAESFYISLQKSIFENDNITSNDNIVINILTNLSKKLIRISYLKN
jgi:hypothetical protein